MPQISRSPFGYADCESELKALKSEYSELYFDETPFNSAAIDPHAYLIIGRRGSGKTALAQYFSFQTVLRDPIYIAVDQPQVYQRVLSDISSRASESRQLAISRLQRVWEYIIWSVIFTQTRALSPEIAQAHDETASPARVSHIVNSIIDRLLVLLTDSSDTILEDRIEQLLTHERFDAAKASVLKIAAERPIIITFDTLEKYDISNDALVNAMAALVQCAAEFNLNFRDRGVHLKVFMSGEVFPYLTEDVLQNPSKSVKSPVYLLWRPKDLLRLISWRFFRYLQAHDLLREESRDEINWASHREVLAKMWIPYFGQYLTDAQGLEEETFSYALRHTQMRPRQLILLCNAIAERSLKAGRFPCFSEDDILVAIREVETDLAIETINSFSMAYKNVSRIVDALMGIPMLFRGNELDKRASQSATEWEDGYSSAKFRRLIAELGIVGRVRRNNEDAGYIDADFEYSLRERLPLTHRDECVIHPMFYSRFNVQINSPSRVMPFSTEREEREVASRDGKEAAARALKEGILHDETLMKAVSRILQRSERQQDLQKIIGSFVDPGIIVQLSNLNDQIMYGRRGTGKTHVLKVLASQLIEDPLNVVLYLDARTLGSTLQFSDPSVPLKQRCLALFRDILGEIYNALLDHIVNCQSSSSDPDFEKLQQLGKVMTEPVSFYTVEGITSRSLDKASGQKSIGLEIGSHADFGLSAKAEEQRQSEEEKTTSYRAEHEDKVVFSALRSLLQDLLKSTKARLFILLDEWSSIPLDVQPFLAEFAKRAFLPSPDVILKIASLEYRSNFGEHLPSGMLGFELGSDISASLDIDEYYVYDRNPDLVSEIFGHILFKHLKSELPEQYLETKYELYAGDGVILKFFSNEIVFKELVRASEGVVRDLINIFISSYFVAQRRGKKRIDRATIIEAARYWFEQDKAKNLDAGLRVILEQIIKEVVAEQRVRSFFLPLELERHPTIQRLFDARVLHLTKRGATYRHTPGIRYNIYTLDYGTYVDLLNTDQAPRMGFEETKGEIPKHFAVPFDDNRTLRLVVLREETLNTKATTVT